MVILGINAIGTRHSGAAQVLLDLLEGLIKIPEIKKIKIFASSDRIFKFPNSDKLEITDAPFITNNLIIRFFWLQFCFGHWLNNYKCDIVYNFNNLAGKLSVPQVLFIQQSLYFSREAINSYFISPNVPLISRIRMLLEPFLMKMFFISANNCKKVIVQTETMKEWVYNKLNIPEDKIIVILPGIPFFFNSKKTAKRKLFKEINNNLKNWLYVGSTAPFKNLKLIYEVAKIAESENVNWKFHIVTSGKSVPYHHPLIKYYKYMDRGTLKEIYLGVDALIMPSLVETVGLPMLEAMSIGIPVVATGRPYAHEICGDNALYFNPHCPSELFQCLLKLSNNIKFCKKLISKQKIRCKIFNQQANTEKTYEILLKAIDKD
jgi:glycosyltransferase involved in cell wall biosynthesis